VHRYYRVVDASAASILDVERRQMDTATGANMMTTDKPNTPAVGFLPPQPFLPPPRFSLRRDPSLQSSRAHRVVALRPLRQA
jgi:hypothetical protein